MEPRYRALKSLLRDLGPCLVAFSGGVDSTLLLRVAHDELGDGAVAVTAVSPSLPAAERDEAVALARSIGAPHLLVETHEIDDPDYARNDGGRCYFCKRELFRVMRGVARQQGGALAAYLNVPAYAEMHGWLGRGALLRPMAEAWGRGDRKAALEAIPDGLVDALFVHGETAACREQVEAFTAAGLRTPVLSIMSAGVARDDLRRILRELAPR